MAASDDVGGLQTLPLDDTKVPPLPVGAPAVGERYELLEMLGKGGMGSVYKAQDRRLGRTVAIKFIIGVDPNLAVRLLREARAQARIDHPNVCRVYEVDEIDHQPYIVFQLVNGEALHVAAARMTLDEKVMVMRDVAAALQASHSLGIVHRDVKPSNIMVKRTENDSWLPIVMDFGLAREVTVEPGITESGAPVGTPAYMSPEQAKGDLHAVDRRSDVYGIGATLYELLTGRPPFLEASLAVMLSLVILDDPPSPRALVPSVPADLETITLKALAKDPSQRYPSARAFADDLDRYLNGEPIVGRRLSLWQRLRRRARRHRALVTLGTVAIAVVAMTASFSVRTWLVARAERQRTQHLTVLAQRLGQDAKNIEFVLRTAYLLPLHDTRRDRENVRAEMNAIKHTPHDLGSLGDAVIHDAVGRGHLSLHQWREAVDELTLATNGGLTTPEVHSARGQALGELYNVLLAEARRSTDKAWLARRQRELDELYLKPAILELEASRRGGKTAALLEARIALYRHDFAAAENGATAIVREAPLLYDARKIAADAAYGAAIEALDRGAYEPARAALDHAVELYVQATDVARSDASLYEATAQTWLRRAELDLRQGRTDDEPFVKALDAIDSALLSEPDNAGILVTKAYVLLRWTPLRGLRNGDDVRPVFERAEQAARRAIEIDEHDANAWDVLGNIHISRSVYEDAHNGSGDTWLQRALDELGTALTLEPNHLWANNDLGAAHRWLGASHDARGLDPLPEYKIALKHYERASAIDPQYLYACTNQADIFAEIAEYDFTNQLDPRVAAERAVEIGERCLRIDANYYSIQDTLAQAQLALARFLVLNGADPLAPLNLAREYLSRVESVNSNQHVNWYYKGVAEGIEADSLLRQGKKPVEAIERGRSYLDRALKIKQEFPLCHVELARLDLLHAKWATHAGDSPIASLESARASIDSAMSRGARSPDAHLIASEIYLQLAAARHSRELAARSLEHVDRAQQLRPRFPGAEAIRAALASLRVP